MVFCSRHRLVFVLLLTVSTGVAADEYTEQRQRLLDEIKTDFAVTGVATGKPELSMAVYQAMAKVPRHEFVPAEQRSRAYLNRPLAIGYGQTVSQPYIVALMTELLEVKTGDTVLEIGTGSGYQAAILAELVDHVYTIEIIRELGEQASDRLQGLGYDNVAARVGDGYYGWEEHAPFEAIIVTAAASHIPPPLVRQLKPGGKMIIPVGSRFMTQYLVMVEKDTNGGVITRQVLPVTFVPLTGGH
ncbi:MAG: protein-L-isoaspartate(D-aspartate) O-methyltransferase [Gammaproteobacteria bacterium]